MPPSPSFSLAMKADIIPADLGLANEPNLDAVCASAFAQLRFALAHYLEQTGDEERWMQLRDVRVAASAVIAGFPRKERNAPSLHEAHELVREMANSGVHDRVTEVEDLAQANSIARNSWP